MITEQDIQFYTINEQWHWEYGEWCSEEGFDLKTEAVDDALDYLNSFAYGAIV